MRRIVALALASSLTLSSAPLFAAQATASLAGTATSSSGQSVANATVHLRNLANGQIAGTTTSSTTGSFSFAGLQAGNYAVEVVNAAGQIIGTSASIGVAAGATVTGIAVSTSAVLAGAAAGAAAAGAGAATAGISTAVIVTTAAAAAGVAGAVAVAKKGDASPSR
ncbi:MAG: hypothetical protein DMG01_15260 [Acidobacteria bacterium]|nr:MAG: hypothetical protein DMG01_15260 [Acidobacteriota bacterium]